MSNGCVHEWTLTPGTDGTEQECRICNQWRSTPVEFQTWRKPTLTYQEINRLRRERVMIALTHFRANDNGADGFREREAEVAINEVLMFQTALQNGAIR